MRGARTTSTTATHSCRKPWHVDYYKRYVGWLTQQRPEVAQHVDPRHIHVRVGGGWRELAQWIDAHTFV